MGLDIDKVAPAAHHLTDEHTVGAQVRKGKEFDLPHLAEHQQGDDGHNNPAINGKAAVPDPVSYTHLWGESCCITMASSTPDP